MTKNTKKGKEKFFLPLYDTKELKERIPELKAIIRTTRDIDMLRGFSTSLEEKPLFPYHREEIEKILWSTGVLTYIDIRISELEAEEKERRAKRKKQRKKNGFKLKNNGKKDRAKKTPLLSLDEAKDLLINASNEGELENAMNLIRNSNHVFWMQNAKTGPEGDLFPTKGKRKSDKQLLLYMYRAKKENFETAAETIQESDDNVTDLQEAKQRRKKIVKQKGRPRKEKGGWRGVKKIA